MLVVGVFHPSLALGQAAGSWEHLAGGGAGPGVGGAAARLSSSQWAGVAAGVERRRVGLWEARTPLTST